MIFSCTNTLWYPTKTLLVLGRSLIPHSPLSATPPIRKAFHLSYHLNGALTQNIKSQLITLSVLIMLKHFMTLVAHAASCRDV
jgi:hypothetical protein